MPKSSGFALQDRGCQHPVFSRLGNVFVSVYTTTMEHDGRAVVNVLLDLADELGLRMTHMALHKIAYFAHGWRLAASSTGLIKQPFEAWKHGPVLSCVYQAFKDSGDKKITKRAMSFNPVTDVSTIATSTFSNEEISILRDVLLAYGRLNAIALSDITHERGGPWDQVWNAPRGKITLGMRISNTAIRDHFLTSQAKGRTFTT